jgi:protein TonB
MPSFGDDTQDILKYIFENLDYSRTEEEIPFRGRIFVRFIVEPTGNLTHFVILKDYNSFYNEKAIHVIQMMVDWKPGECDGLKVPVFYIIPVSFSLN